MESKFPLASNEPFLGSDAPVELDLGRDRSRASGFFKWIPYKAIGQFTGTLDYVLIVTASIVAGAAYHSLILWGDIPDLMPYLAAGNLVAAIFIFGFTSRGHYSPSAIVSPRRQVRSIVFFWSLAFLSLALFLFLAKSGADFSRGTVIIFGLSGFVLLVGSHVWISATFKSALARGAIAGDRAITIGDRDAMLALSQASVLQKAGAREIRRYLLPPFNGSGYAAGLRVVEDAIQFARSNGVDCILLALQWSDALSARSHLRAPAGSADPRHAAPGSACGFDLLQGNTSDPGIYRRAPAAAFVFGRTGAEARFRPGAGERVAHCDGAAVSRRCHADQIGIHRTGDLLATAQGI